MLDVDVNIVVDAWRVGQVGQIRHHIAVFGRYMQGSRRNTRPKSAWLHVGMLGGRYTARYRTLTAL